MAAPKDTRQKDLSAFLPGINLDRVAEERQRLAETIFNKALAFLMHRTRLTRRHRDAGASLAGRGADCQASESLARLWPGIT